MSSSNKNGNIKISSTPWVFGNNTPWVFGNNTPWVFGNNSDQMSYCGDSFGYKSDTPVSVFEQSSTEKFSMHENELIQNTFLIKRLKNDLMMARKTIADKSREKNRHQTCGDNGGLTLAGLPCACSRYLDSNGLCYHHS